jgi:hypothetical protein
MGSAFDELNHILRSHAHVAAQSACYDEWSDEFCRKEARQVWRDERRSSPHYRITREDFLTLTDAERKMLGFAKWSDNGPWLIPLWAFNYIKDGETLRCITGLDEAKRDSIDLDTRGGCIAYGFAE